jgi:hypothetical protein
MAVRIGPALVLAICAAVALLSCGSPSPMAGHHSSSSARQQPSDARRAGDITTCGSSGLRAISGKQTWPLLSCSGSANVNPLPSVTLRPGNVVTIVNGVGPTHLALHGGDVLAIDGLHLTPLHPGSTLVTVSGWPWCFVVQGPPPRECPLLRITVSPNPRPSQRGD